MMLYIACIKVYIDYNKKYIGLYKSVYSVYKEKTRRYIHRVFVDRC